MSHPVYGIGTSALVYIGDEVSDRADGVPIGTVVLIGTGGMVQVNADGDLPHQIYSDADLCLVKRAEP